MNVILANTGTVACFRTASPIDGQLMLSQLTPTVELSDIVNLPRYRFLMKLASIEPTEPFSVETLSSPMVANPEIVEAIIAASRKNYASRYKKATPTVAPKRPHTKASLSLNVGSLT